MLPILAPGSAHPALAGSSMGAEPLLCIPQVPKLGILTEAFSLGETRRSLFCINFRQNVLAPADGCEKQALQMIAPF